jgi:transcriptional regulator with XRE-family HTH domain
MTHFGLYLRARRQHCGLSLRQLEHASGIDHVRIYEIEHGTSSPTLEVVGKLAKGLGDSERALMSSFYSPRSYKAWVGESR